MDFNIGAWHTDITRYPDPFNKPEQSVHIAGTVVNRPIWNGKAQLEEIAARSTTGPWESGTLFLYDPEAHQWSQNGFDSDDGRFGIPTIGEWRNGNLEFYGQGKVGGRTVLLRGTWSDIKPDSHTYTIARSIDGGRTWHDSFIGRLTRLQAVPAGTFTRNEAAAPSTEMGGSRERDGSHDMDFAVGDWRTDVTVIKNPFDPNSPVTHLAGTKKGRPIWGGKGLVEEIEADGPDGHWQAANLFLYDVQAHQWRQTYFDSRSGELDKVSGVGALSDGRIEFFWQDEVAGRTLLIRGTWKDFTPHSHTYEVARSADGGRSWYPSFIARVTSAH